MLDPQIRCFKYVVSNVWLHGAYATLGGKHQQALYIALYGIFVLIIVKLLAFIVFPGLVNGRCKREFLFSRVGNLLFSNSVSKVLPVAFLVQSTTQTENTRWHV